MYHQRRADSGSALRIAEMAKKEIIKPPTKKETTDGSKELRGGHSSGGRTMADASVAARQGVADKGKSKKR
jgi:hypothetical protein